MSSDHPAKVRISILTNTAVKNALHQLAKKWNCRTNHAAGRAILMALNSTDPQPEMPPWAVMLNEKLDEILRQI